MQHQLHAWKQLGLFLLYCTINVLYVPTNHHRCFNTSVGVQVIMCSHNTSKYWTCVTKLPGVWRCQSMSRCSHPHRPESRVSRVTCGWDFNVITVRGTKCSCKTPTHQRYVQIKCMSWLSYREEEGLGWNLDKMAAKQEATVHFLFQPAKPGNVSDHLEDFQLCLFWQIWLF